jgi:hypothetical protein
MNTSKDKLNKTGKSSLRTKSVGAWLSILCLASFLATVTWQSPASAQNAPIQPPNSLLNWGQPGQPAPEGDPPPPGSGANPDGVTAGDQGGTPPVPTGQATQGTGNNFPTIQNMNRTTVYVYAQTYEHVYPGPSAGGQASDISTQGTYRGKRMVMTIRGNTLTSQQMNTIGGILGVNFNGGQETIQADATNDQIEQINEALYPDASQQGWGISTLQGDGRLKIMQDPSDAQWSKIRRPLDTSLYKWVPTLPIVPVFCRYFIILGVVIATVFVAKAGYSMCFGHAYAGTRAVAAITGLATLLCAFTIYKIVILNLMHANSTTVQSNVKSVAGAGNPTQTPNVPIVPQVPNGQPPRAGIPVIPLSGN